MAEQPDEFVPHFDEVMRENLRRVIATQDSVLLGRRTVEEWSAFWPDSVIEPFSSFINGVPKFVVTSTPPERAWANTTIVQDGPAELVNELKQQPGGDIGVHGSISLAQWLLEADLIDELRLVIAPAVTMVGRKLFERGNANRLTLTRCLPSPTGYLLVDYAVRN